MGIKIGNIDASYFKVGSDDCKVYLGDTLLYPSSQPQTLQWVEYSNGDTISSDLDIYGISGTAFALSNAFGNVSDNPISIELNKNKVNIFIGYGCYEEYDIPSTNNVELIFSNLGCSDYYNQVQGSFVIGTIQLYIYA